MDAPGPQLWYLSWLLIVLFLALEADSYQVAWPYDADRKVRVDLGAFASDFPNHEDLFHLIQLLRGPWKFPRTLFETKKRRVRFLSLTYQVSSIAKVFSISFLELDFKSMSSFSRLMTLRVKSPTFSRVVKCFDTVSTAKEFARFS